MSASRRNTRHGKARARCLVQESGRTVRGVAFMPVSVGGSAGEGVFMAGWMDAQRIAGVCYCWKKAGITGQTVVCAADLACSASSTARDRVGFIPLGNTCQGDGPGVHGKKHLGKVRLTVRNAPKFRTRSGDVPESTRISMWDRRHCKGVWLALQGGGTGARCMLSR